MRFETAFSVPGEPASVIERFADVPAMAACLPGASVEPPNAEGSYPATLVVSFGPKRIAFKGSLTNEVDRGKLSGVLKGRASADMRAAKMAVEMSYTLSADPAAGQGNGTRVLLVSEAELTGVLADFANTGGVAVTNAILEEFARRFAAQYGPTPAVEAKGSAPAEGLSGGRLLRALLGGLLSRLGGLLTGRNADRR